MPLHSLVTLKPFILESLYNAISGSGDFDTIEAAVAAEVERVTNYTAPDDPADTKAWIKECAANMIAFASTHLIPDLDEATLKQINLRNEFALRKLASWNYLDEDDDDDTQGVVLYGAFEEEDEW